MGGEGSTRVGLGEDRVAVQGGKTTAYSEGSRGRLRVHLGLSLFLSSKGSESTHLQDQENVNLSKSYVEGVQQTHVRVLAILCTILYL